MVGARGEPSVSVIVITRDEAVDLPACLAAVSWATQIVVVDHGSVDGTPELARRAGAMVVETADWPGFGVQKQRALELATSDWVLNIDADERVGPGLEAELASTLPQTRHAAFTLPFHTFVWGRRVRGGQYLFERKLRLARRASARFLPAIVHERLIVDGSVGRLRTPVRHETFASPSELDDKIRRYAYLAARQLHHQGIRAGRGRAIAEVAWAYFHLLLLRLGLIDGLLGLELAAATARERYLRFRELERLNAS